MDTKAVYNEWLTDSYFDDDTKAELKSIAGNEDEINDRFYKELEFGTAGLRGVMGAGTNRMNVYTVRKATQGLANYINKTGNVEKGVAIAYDSRHNNTLFADTAALCLNANGIKAYVFDALRPTPELSFAVRELGCTAGINITASHNPAEYNGYKVYWEDGAQITPPHDTGIMDEVKKVTEWKDVKTMDKAEAVEKGLYNVIGKEIDDKYIDAVKSQIIHQDAIDKMKDTLKIVYTPFHGTGNVPVMRVLKEIGFKNVYEVPEQAEPDGDFTTVPYPNPEDKKNFELALKLAKEKDADLVLATDPDADRLGVYAKDSKTGEYMEFTGNMSGSLLAEYELSERKRLNGSLPADGKLVKSIVTTNLVDEVAKNYGVELVEVLTGFKWIGREILKYETEGKGTYCFGLEESYGCLIGTHARDKDAVMASTALCEAAAFYKTQGKTLWDVMLDMYERYGYYNDSVQSIEMKGITGLQKIADIMTELRENPPVEVSQYKVLKIRDYLKDTVTDLSTGKTVPTGLPKSNVLYFELSDRAWMCVRPSGTEPKIKFYIGIVGENLKDAEEKSAVFGEKVKELVESL